jgi:aspartyl-tRNA(Asn)/glutamyl-tRNA(Gln) amidotransferase subunit C
MSAVISREEVAHLARLSRLAVTDAELDRFAGQLDVILQAVARVGEVAAADIPPTSHAVPLTNVLREDVVVPGLARDEALAGAPDTADAPDAAEGTGVSGAPEGDVAAAGPGRYFRVPRILDEEA